MDVQELADKRAIMELQVRYSKAIDTGNYDDLDNVFLPDVVADYGRAGQHQGVDKIKDTCREALDPLTGVQHLNGNHWAEIDGDTARAGCYFSVHQYLDGMPGGEHYRMGGEYVDDLVRTDAGWRISRRSLTLIWADGNPDVRYLR